MTRAAFEAEGVRRDEVKTAKTCVVCKVGPREVPDRNRMGSPIKRVCRQCHGKRLLGDLAKIAREASRR